MKNKPITLSVKPDRATLIEKLTDIIQGSEFAVTVTTEALQWCRDEIKSLVAERDQLMETLDGVLVWWDGDFWMFSPESNLLWAYQHSRGNREVNRSPDGVRLEELVEVMPPMKKR